MIISKTPLRIEFTGGSDLPAFYNHEPGAIVNATINKYVYVLVRHPDFPSSHKLHLSHDKVEKLNDINKIKHALIRETLKFKKINSISLSSFSDLPSQTGLGSSGSFTVGLLTILNHLNGKKISPKKVAQEAFYIENKLVGINCGPQDQLAAAHGGINLHQFFQGDKTKSKKIMCTKETVKLLEDNLLMFYTGKKRSSANLLDNLSETLKKSKKARRLMSKRVELSHLMFKRISQNSLETFGEMLDEDWKYKKAIAPIETNNFIDTIYNKAIKHGAKGGKLVGAGGSGFMLFYAPKEKHNKIKKALSSLQYTDFSFTEEGSKIIR